MKVREKTHENIKPSWVDDQEKLICCYKFRHFRIYREMFVLR